MFSIFETIFIKVTSVVTNIIIAVGLVSLPTPPAEIVIEKLPPPTISQKIVEGEGPTAITKTEQHKTTVTPPSPPITKPSLAPQLITPHPVPMTNIISLPNGAIIEISPEDKILRYIKQPDSQPTPKTTSQPILVTNDTVTPQTTNAEIQQIQWRLVEQEQKIQELEKQLNPPPSPPLSRRIAIEVVPVLFPEPTTSRRFIVFTLQADGYVNGQKVAINEPPISVGGYNGFENLHLSMEMTPEPEYETTLHFGVSGGTSQKETNRKYVFTTPMGVLAGRGGLIFDAPNLELVATTTFTFTLHNLYFSPCPPYIEEGCTFPQLPVTNTVTIIPAQ